jgi:hypothetical protein
VSVTNPDGSLWIPFDGFASIPQIDYSARNQSVTFCAQNVAIRNVSLQVNVGSDQGEAPSYGWVVGVSWVFEPTQQTILQISDRRAEPQPYRG